MTPTPTREGLPELPEAVSAAFRALTREDSTPEEIEARMFLMRHILANQPRQSNLFHVMRREVQKMRSIAASMRKFNAGLDPHAAKLETHTDTILTVLQALASQPTPGGGEVTELMVQWARDYLLESGAKVSEYDVRCAIENALRAAALPHPQPVTEKTPEQIAATVAWVESLATTPPPPSDADHIRRVAAVEALMAAGWSWNGTFWDFPTKAPSDAAQGEASLTDLYWHITRNALKDGSPFAMECMKGLRALNDAAQGVTPPVDCLGLALDLEQQAERQACSQTAERAMRAAATGLRRLAASQSVRVDEAMVDAGAALSTTGRQNDPKYRARIRAIIEAALAAHKGEGNG